MNLTAVKSLKFFRYTHFRWDNFAAKHGDSGSATSSYSGPGSRDGFAHGRIGAHKIRGDLYQSEELPSTDVRGVHHRRDVFEYRNKAGDAHRRADRDKTWEPDTLRRRQAVSRSR